jgi:hypothetical protein
LTQGLTVLAVISRPRIFGGFGVLREQNALISRGFAVCGIVSLVRSLAVEGDQKPSRILLGVKIATVLHPFFKKGCKF